MFLIAKTAAALVAALLAVWVILACLGAIWKVPPARWENVAGAIVTVALLWLSYLFNY